MSTEMMQAVRFHQFGPPEVLVLDSIPRPASPGEGQVLVRVRAAGVNPIDTGIRAGLVQNRVPIKLPGIPGVELSGTIEEVGSDITTFVQGQAIYSNCISNIGNGSSVEYMLLPVNTVFPMPRNLNFEQAATVAHGARTAWSGLFEYGDLQPGQRVLVQGGSGGVGIYAVQLAHVKGAYVISTTSTQNMEFVRGLGADEVIDYTQTNFEDVVKEVDMVYDCVGGEVMERSWQALKTGGILVSATGFPSEETASKLGVRCARVMYPKDLPAMLQQITALIETEEIKPHIRKIFSMEMAPQAHALCETRHGRGRIILHIAD
jgi:NADPH:quinone reductase-like Zn-dependent oxidoreductase